MPIENQSVESLAIYTGMTRIIEEIRSIFQGMADGDRIAVDDLVAQIAHKVELPKNQIHNIVSMYLKECRDATVEGGRGGGVFKGGRPKKIDDRPRCPTCDRVWHSSKPETIPAKPLM